MIIDGLQLFTGTSNGASGGITASAYTDLPTTGTQAASNVIDYGITGGTPAGGATTPANRDMGIGDDPSLKLLATVEVAFTGGTSLQVHILGAPDNGAGAPGAYTLLWQGPVVVEANLTIGAQLANNDFPRQIPGVGPARFIEAQFVSVGTHGAGQISVGIQLDRFDQILGTTGALSGYPAGINVAN